MKESNSYIRFERTRPVDLEFLTTGTDYLYTAACNLPASGGYLPARGCYLPARGVICLPSINLSNDFHYDFIGLRKTSAQTSPPIIPFYMYVGYLTICIPYSYHSLLPSPTQTFLLLPLQLPFVSDATSTPLLFHPPPYEFLSPSSTPHTHLFLSNPILIP